MSSGVNPFVFNRLTRYVILTLYLNGSDPGGGQSSARPLYKVESQIESVSAAGVVVYGKSVKLRLNLNVSKFYSALS